MEHLLVSEGVTLAFVGDVMVLVRTGDANLAIVSRASPAEELAHVVLASGLSITASWTSEAGDQPTHEVRDAGILTGIVRLARGLRSLSLSKHWRRP